MRLIGRIGRHHCRTHHPNINNDCIIVTRNSTGKCVSLLTIERIETKFDSISRHSEIIRQALHILPTGKGESRAPRVIVPHADSGRKRKNELSIGADPMSLLTDDDIEELRAEFKDELRRRYLQGLNEDGASEPASFEALLEDRQQRKRR